MDRVWLKKIGNGIKKVWVFPRMDYRGNIVEDFYIFNKYCDEMQFYIMDLPEKLVQESKEWSSIDYLADEAFNLMGQYIPRPDYMIGISMGGMIVQELLCKPTLCEIPVLIISSNIWANTKLKAIFSSWMIAVKQIGTGAFDMILYPWICLDSELPVSSCDYKIIDTEEQEIAERKILLSLKSVAEHDARKLQMYKQLQITFWRGEHSVLISQVEEEEFKAHVPELNVIHIPECGMRILNEKSIFAEEKLKEFFEL